jgi:hypothetical protein
LMANPARLVGASAEVGGDAARLMDEFIAEGLISTEFIPRGETDKERCESIKSKAYVEWLKKTARETCAMSVEECRTAFLERNGGPHQFGGRESALPKGDAWEGGG